MNALMDDYLKASAATKPRVDENLLGAVWFLWVREVGPPVSVAAKACEPEEPAQAGEREMVVFGHP